jgi:hypothetical protein
VCSAIPHSGNPGKSRYRGVLVSWDKGQKLWRALTSPNSKQKHIGRFAGETTTATTARRE